MTDWNLRTTTLDAIAEEAIANNATLVGMAKIGIELEGRGDEAAYECSGIIREAFKERVSFIANNVWVARNDEMNALAIGEYDIYDMLDEAFQNEARGISYE